MVNTHQLTPHKVIWLFALCLGVFFVVQAVYVLASSFIMASMSVVDNPDTLKDAFPYFLRLLPQLIVGWQLIRLARRRYANLPDVTRSSGQA